MDQRRSVKDIERICDSLMKIIMKTPRFDCLCCMFRTANCHCNVIEATATATAFSAMKKTTTVFQG